MTARRIQNSEPNAFLNICRWMFLVFGGSVPWQAVEKLRLRPPFSVARLSPMLTYA